MITKQELDSLVELVAGFAHFHDVVRVHAFKACTRHLTTAKLMRGESRAAAVGHAHSHFQFLKAAAVEKATRGKA